MRWLGLDWDGPLNYQTQRTELYNSYVDKLLETGACYKAEDGAIMYRSAQYAAKYGVVNKRKTDDGSEEEAKDEVLVRANGIPTYFAADIAYHYNKLAVRGFDKAIDVWGADHHGHVARLKGAMTALGYPGDDITVILMQLVRLYRGGEIVKMSKRSGKYVTLDELIEEVGKEAARFFFIMRSRILPSILTSTSLRPNPATTLSIMCSTPTRASAAFSPSLA